MDGRARVGLRQDERSGASRPSACALPASASAARRSRVVAQDAEPGVGDRLQPRSPPSRDELVLRVAEEREVVIAPASAGTPSALGHLGRRSSAAARASSSSASVAARARASRASPRRPRGRPEDPLDAVMQLRELGRVGLAVDLDVQDRLARSRHRRRAAGVETSISLPSASRRTRDDRMDHQVDAEAQPARAPSSPSRRRTACRR